MKSFHSFYIILLLLFVFGCRNSKNTKTEKFEYKIKKSEVKTPKNGEKVDPNNEIPASKVVDLNNKGIGPISNVSLSSQVNSQMATEGSEIFKKLCTACHKIGKKFIGPAPNGILERRTPEWIMNMILDPEGMVKNDPLAKQLLIEFNGSPMANQSLSEKEARAVLEYFRTLN